MEEEVEEAWEQLNGGPEKKDDDDEQEENEEEENRKYLSSRRGKKKDKKKTICHQPLKWPGKLRCANGNSRQDSN